MTTKHGWNTFDNYLRVHEKVLRTYSGHIFTQDPQYTISQITENYYEMKISRLDIQTEKGTRLLVKIEKDILIKQGARRKQAKTSGYSYHAVDKSTDRNLIRYCSPHFDHNNFHHKHDYRKNPPLLIKIREEDVPHVSEFFDELIDNF